MARRKAASVTRTKSGDSVVVVAPPTAPVRRSGGRRRAAAPKKKHHRRRPGGAWSMGGYRTAMIATGVGGAVYGFIEKQFPNMPTIPLLGKSGTVALACYFFGNSVPIARNVGIAAAAIAGYSLGGTGQISGYFGDSGGLASQT